MTTLTDGPVEFSRTRLFVWPVHRHELKKLLPMLLIFFLVSFDYNVLRTLKDTVVIKSPDSGVEVIPFLKMWAMFPCTLLMTYFFTRLSNRYSRQMVTYIMMGGFLLYFALFVGVAFPNRDALTPTAMTTAMREILPSSFKWPIVMFHNWIATSFYVMAELWSNIIFFMLFWGFANQITRLHEAKRFYGILGVGANLSGIAAGQASVFLSKLQFNPNLPYGSERWEQTIFFLLLTVIAVGGAILWLFQWMHRNVLNDPIYYDTQEAQAEGRLQGTLSLRDSFRYLLNSPYLLCLALIVIAYNVVINLIEVIWKFQVNELYSSPSDYNIYMNHVSTIIAIIATLSALIVSSNSIRKFGWTFTAMLTPAILMLSSVMFFGFFFLQNYRVDGSALLLGFSPLALVVFAGSAQNIICRAAKYSVYDATKEMAFVPLTTECKLKGKAAIDGVGTRLGKAGGSLIHQALLITLDSFSNTAPYVAALLLSIIAIWMAAVRVLGHKFNSLTGQAPISTTEAPATASAGDTARVALATSELSQQNAL